MDRLPLEIKRRILSTLPKHTLCCCLLVSKKWHSFVIPVLYHTIVIHKRKVLDLFLDNICSLQPTSFISTSIKHIRLIDISLADLIRNNYFTFSMDAIYSKHIVDEIYKYFPNLETLICNRNGYGFSDEGRDKSKVAKERSDTQKYSDTEQEYIEHLLNNEDNISGIEMISRNESSFKGLGGIVKYLSLFPYLTSIGILYKDKSATPNELYFQIVQNYPDLKQLHYGPGWNTDDMFSLKTYTQFTSIKIFNIKIAHMTSHHIQYIKNTFPSIRELKVTISETEYDEDMVRNILSTFSAIELGVELHGYTEETVKTILDDFWELVSTYKMKKHHAKNVDIIYTQESTSPNLCVSIHKSARYEEGYHSNIRCSNPDPTYFFKGCGQEVHKLRLENFPTAINVNDINRTFPELKIFQLNNCSVIVDSDEIPVKRTGMKALLLSDICVNQPFIERMYTLYPKLTELEVPMSEFYPCKGGFDIKKEVYSLLLPWNSLIYLSLWTHNGPYPLKSIIIKRMRGKVMENSWHYKNQNGRFHFISHKASNDKYIGRLTLPILIVESYSIKDVSSNCNL